MLQRKSILRNLMYALGLIVLVSFAFSFTKEDGGTWSNNLQSIRNELISTTAPHQRAEAYEGALAIVVTNSEVLISKQGLPAATSTSNSFILEFEDIENVKTSLGKRIDIPTANLVRDGDGSVYILNTSNGILITFKMESKPDRMSYFKNDDVSIKKVFSPRISIATTQRTSADYAETVQTIIGKTEPSPVNAGTYDDGPAGPYDIACRCKNASTADDICNSGGEGATGCGVSDSNGTGCSISGCGEDQYACCGIATENDGK